MENQQCCIQRDHRNLKGDFFRARLVKPKSVPKGYKPVVDETLPVGSRRVVWLDPKSWREAIMAGTHSENWWHADLERQWQLCPRPLDVWDVV